MNKKTIVIKSENSSFLYTNNNAITMVALVVTIIVLIILAGVSINALIGENGLIAKAKDAKDETELAKEKEDEIIDGRIEVGGVWYDSISDYIAGLESEDQSGVTGGNNTNNTGNNETINVEEKFSEIYTENTTITQGDYKAVVPKGYAVGTSEGVNKIENGLVITDAVDENSNSIGNEFVWIPVRKPIVTEEEIATLRANDETLTTDLLAVQSLVNAGIYPMAVQVGENYKGLLYDFTGRTNLTAEVYDWTSETGYREPGILTETWTSNYVEDAREGLVVDSQDIFTIHGLGTYTDTLYQEAYNSMVESVAKNGGFYVGRYEVSEGTYINSENNTISYAQSKANEESTSKEWQEIYKYGREYKNSKENLGIESEMVWASQWQQIMVFVNGRLDVEGIPFWVTLTAKRSDSDNITGNNDIDKIANIFDLETGSNEWTQGAGSLLSRSIFSMGKYGDTSGPAASSYALIPFSNYGGRITLYVLD